MALDKPIIIITQSINDLPFDIRDIQSIQYTRSRLSASLSADLRRMSLDTLARIDINSCVANRESTSDSEIIGALLKEVAQLKEIICEAVHAWKSEGSLIPRSASELQSLSGHWLNTESESHVYANCLWRAYSPYLFAGGTTNSLGSILVGAALANIGSPASNGWRSQSQAFPSCDVSLLTFLTVRGGQQNRKKRKILRHRHAAQVFPHAGSGK